MDVEPLTNTLSVVLVRTCQSASDYYFQADDALVLILWVALASFYGFPMAVGYRFMLELNWLILSIGESSIACHFFEPHSFSLNYNCFGQTIFNMRMPHKLPAKTANNQSCT